ncbi:16S rRNA (uracil(1498)-N(3))-methyltransferase [Kordiimonas sp.]|uniref:16S rRNA (uracil(1498)-N(3))-methyltransferase n=1 Tax=Kordiimonas sp. TaxID=1970157 RepID=UPI003A8D7C92
MAKKIQHRLFIEDSLPGGGIITLGNEQSHYLANVMRANVGTAVALFNGQDGEWAAEIIDVKKREVTLKIAERTREQTGEPNLWLAFAPIKKARLDFMAQKATELGVNHMIPVYTRRTIVDRVKTDRLRANATEAAEQCERLNVPTSDEPIKLEKLLATWPDDRMIMFCDEDLSGDSAYTALSRADNKESPKPWAIIIGPEGGFDDDERRMIRAHKNTVVVSLGPRVLRADTAAMAAISLWQAAIGDW